MPELLKITDFRAIRPERIHPTPTGNRDEVYRASAPQFRLTRYRPEPNGPAVLPHPGPGVAYHAAPGTDATT